MKKIFLMGLLSFLTVSANADSWKYSLLEDDFDGNLKIASIDSDKNKINLSITKRSNSKSAYLITFLLPKGFLTNSDCNSTCITRVIADGEEVERIELRGIPSDLKTYDLQLSSREHFLNLFQNSKVIKIQLPTYHGMEIVTFTQPEPLNLEKLESVK